MAYVKSASTSRSQVEALLSTYKQAPSKTLKTQILSIYALRFTVSELKETHATFEKLSDRQIKKARSHAKKVGAGLSSCRAVGAGWSSCRESSLPQSMH